ncbi:hypothetical protein C8A05DRAFT_11785 [Staphylotrichum tortipilum]|uniref:Uncharacterized protein n=1 Tax=Staphylotrichum tortipilum TaxID=2831512 RepID=A0AAN6MSV0_9PEZI|nr:hypothetical protein C8A05DRAFT_11785 [Staphylotrichum longicolle]
MLRLRPTAISLTATDVSEVVHRRRFRRFLECDDDMCIVLTPTETEAIYNATRAQPSSLRSRTAGRKGTPAKSNGAWDRSPPAYNRMRPLVVNLPSLSSERAAEDGSSPTLGPSSRQLSRSESVGRHHGGSAWTPQLCLRPRRSLEGATSPSSETDAGRSAGPQDARVSADTAETESEAEAGPSTPCRGASSSRSPGGLQTPPPQASRVCSARSDLDMSSQRQRHRVQSSGSHAESSPPAPTAQSPRRLRVYSDLLPASSQPQTPQNLPEARHQSRLQGSYTAPTRRTSPQPMTPTSSRGRGASVRRRGLSPPGLQTPGFQGLYGGTENMDDTDLAREMAQGRPTATSRPSSSP